VDRVQANLGVVVDNTTVQNGGIGRYLCFYLSSLNCGKLCGKVGVKLCGNDNLM
jgi:hypothetical protein